MNEFDHERMGIVCGTDFSGPAACGDMSGALRALDRLRKPLFRELAALLRDPDYVRKDPGARVCRRARNQMRISPLEAWAIARALESRPELADRLTSIRRRLRRELARLDDGTRRQNFTCPLLEDGLCLVHHAAKPIGCLAWNPGRPYTDAAWKAFAERDRLNDEAFGPNWKLRAIPLGLARVLGERLPGKRGKKVAVRERTTGVSSVSRRRRRET